MRNRAVFFAYGLRNWPWQDDKGDHQKAID